MSSFGENTSDKIEKKLKEIRQGIEDMGGNNDTFCYKLKDELQIPIQQALDDVTRPIEENIQEVIDD